MKLSKTMDGAFSLGECTCPGGFLDLKQIYTTKRIEWLNSQTIIVPSHAIHPDSEVKNIGDKGELLVYEGYALDQRWFEV